MSVKFSQIFKSVQFKRLENMKEMYQKRLSKAEKSQYQSKKEIDSQ
jgi:response regulator of citrate/malate metabolism